MRSSCQIIVRIVFVLGLAACPDPGEGADKSPEPSLVCGPGTRAQNGVCVIERIDAGPEITCQPGTRLNEAQTGCVPDVRCAAGTEPNASGTGCVLICEDGFVLENDACACPAGLIANASGNTCVLDPALCGEGTIFIDGTCSILAPPPVADDDLDPAQTPVFFDLPEVQEKPVELGGIIDVPTRESGADLDVFRFTGQAGDRLRIQTIGFGAQGASFLLTGIDAANENYYRLALPLYNRRAVREVVLPADGRYAIIVSDRSNLLELFGVSGIPVGGPDQSYGLVVDTLPSPPARVVDADGEPLSGRFDDVDAYRVSPQSAALGAILQVRMPVNENDPNLLTQPVVWYVDSTGRYQEWMPDGTGEVDAFVPQLGSGMVLHVDYAWRLDGAPDVTYDLRILAPALQMGPVPGEAAAQGNTGGNEVTFFPLTLRADHVYRIRMELPSTTTIPNATFRLLNPMLQPMGSAEDVIFNGTAYQELRKYAGPDDVGTHYLTVISDDVQEPLTASNFNVRWTVDEAEVRRGGGVPTSTTTVSEMTLPAPSVEDNGNWQGPWVLTTVSDIGRLEIQTTDDVDFEAYDASDFTKRVATSELIFPGACSVGEENWIEQSQVIGANLGSAGNQFSQNNIGCGVGSGGDFILRIKPQAPGVTVEVSVASAADTSVGFMRSCQESCIGLSDSGFDGDTETSSYTFTGQEPGPLLVVIDSWFSATDDVTVTVNISGQSGEGTLASSARTYEVKGGDQILVRTFDGTGSGTFVHRAKFVSSPLPWEEEPNNAADAAGEIPSLLRTWTAVEEGACLSGGTTLPASDGTFVWETSAAIGNDFQETAWSGCGMSGVDAYLRLPAQPEGTVTHLSLALASDNAIDVEAEIQFGLLRSEDCSPGTAQCLNTQSTNQLATSNGLELNYTWGVDETDLIVLLDTTAQAEELAGARWELSVDHSHLPLPDLVWHGLISEGDADWWRMDVNEAGRLQIFVGDGALSPSGDVLVQLYDESAVNIIAETVYFLSSASAPGTFQTYVMPGTYYAVVTLAEPQELSFLGQTFVIGGQEGSYSLAWRLLPSSTAPPTCASPVLLPGAGEYRGDTREGLRNWAPADASCTGGPPSDYASSDWLYQIDIPPMTVLRASATRQDGSDPVLAVVDGSCDAACLVGADDPFTAAAVETVVWPNTSSETQSVLLIVDAWGGNTGEFLLEVELILTECDAGAQRCSDDGYREICAADGSGFERSFCEGGCIFDDFELTAVCRPYCGNGTELPRQRCNGARVETCSADGERYERQSCDVACAEFAAPNTLEIVGAQCALGVCQPSEVRCDAGGDGGFVAESCDAEGGLRIRTSCAAGCAANGQQCAAVQPRVISETFSTGVCLTGTSTGDVVSEGGRASYVPAGTEGNDFDDGNFACGAAGGGADMYLRLAPKPAGTQVRVKASALTLDLQLGFQLSCDAGLGTCLGASNAGGAGVEETATYTYDGTESSGLLLVVESGAETWSENIVLQVDFSDSPALLEPPTICAPDTQSCTEGKETLCNDAGVRSETVYCAYGCDANGEACAPTPLVLGDSCANPAELAADGWLQRPPVFAFSLQNLMDDTTCNNSEAGGRDGVFSFVAPSNQGFSFTFEGAPLWVAVYAGICGGGQSTCVAVDSVGPSVSVPTQAGIEYFVVVDQANPNDDVSDLRMRVHPSIVP